GVICGPDMVVLRTPVKRRGKDFTTVGEFTVAAGETVPFVLTYGASYLTSPGLIDATEALRETKTFWRGWANLVKSSGRWSDAVQRSLITELRRKASRRQCAIDCASRISAAGGSAGEVDGRRDQARSGHRRLGAALRQ